MGRKLYEQEVRQHLLALRESLVRHDENLKAYALLSECVPYFLRDDEVVTAALADQTTMTAHMRDENTYADYYGNNPHELPFEEQFGGTVEWAIENNGMRRIKWLIEQLKLLDVKNVLDVACNDGAIARYIADETGCNVEGVDLNPDCVKRAAERGISARHGTIFVSDLAFDAVYAMEVIEHVPDPVDFLKKLASRAPHVFITTPYGATAQGDVPSWDVVEYKGHVRAVLPEDVKLWGEQAELENEFIGITEDGILVAHYQSAR